MPSQPSSTGAEPLRLADVFVRVPSHHHQQQQQQSSKPTAPSGQKTDSSKQDTTPASSQHRLPTSSKPEPALTPQKPKPAMTTPEANQVNHHPLPPTPDATPTKTTLKRPFPQTPPPTSLSSSAKRPRTHNTHQSPATPTPSPSPHRLRRFLTPKFSIVYQPPQQSHDNGEKRNDNDDEEEEKEEKETSVSWLELKRVAESVMRQVDWEEVAEDAASNRGAGWYRRVVRGVLQERIEEIVGREGEEGEK